MADMTTTLVKFSQNGNSVTYHAPGHSVQTPKLLLQKRKLPANAANAVAETTTSVVYGAVDAANVPLFARTLITITARRPVAADQVLVDEAIALARDYVASDDFTAAVNAQLFAGG